jgi:hypothetical protein
MGPSGVLSMNVIVANLTLAIDDDLLRRAREAALRENTIGHLENSVLALGKPEHTKPHRVGFAPFFE